MLAYSWRLAQGEVPYRDFLFVRTPLTPYLHSPALLLPDGWQIQAGRLAFSLELALSGLLPTLWASARLGLRATPRSLALAAICFLFAVHNFPPMPWPTVDAVLFASAGATAFLFSLEAGPRSALALRASASVLLALAVLAKQAFAPLPVLLAAYALVEAGRARSPGRLVASVVPGALVGLAMIAALAAAGALPAFLQQIGEPTRLRPSVEIPWSGDPVSVGLAPYVRALSPAAIVLMLAAFTLAWSRDAAAPTGSLLRRVSSAVLFAAFAALAVEAQFDTFSAGRQLSWMLVAALGALLLRMRDRADRLTCTAYVCILAIAWCASLSFAYQTPLLGLAGAGFLFERAFGRTPWPAERLAVALAAALVLVSVLTLQLDRPYRDVPRAGQTADLGEIYPRFGRLLTNPANHERFRELRELATRHASRESFVVIPDYPLISFLAGVRSPLSLDWLQPQEYLGNEGRLLDELVTRRPVVLIQREPSLTVGPSSEPPYPCDRPPGPLLRLTAHVVSRWTLLAEGRHFCVYRAPG